MAGEKGATWINDYLKLLFTATPVANIADNAASAPLTNLYVSLHTADPLAAGSQTTSETAYTSYARVAVARSSSGWTVSGTSVVPFTAITFPACTGSTSTITHFAVGTASSGAGKLLYAGPVTPSISVSTGVTPQITTATSISEQ